VTSRRTDIGNVLSKKKTIKHSCIEWCITYDFLLAFHVKICYYTMPFLRYYHLFKNYKLRANDHDLEMSFGTIVKKTAQP